MTPRAAAAALATLALAGPAASFTPEPPDGATISGSQTDPPAPHATAIGPATPMSPPRSVVVEAARTRIAYHAPEGDALRLLDSLRGQLAAAGFQIVFTCAAPDCGGFDFRRAQPALPLPQMVLGLSDFSYVAARRGPPDAPDAMAGLIASDTAVGAYAQITLVGPISAPSAPTSDPAAGRGDGDTSRPLPRRPSDRDGAAPATPVAPADPATAASSDAPGAPAQTPPAGGWDAARIDAAFAEAGRIPLDGLRFASGTATLDGEPPAALDALADWLAADPARRLALVGHTDNTGPPALNRSLSRARAAAVADLMTGRYGADPSQITVEGAGPFAPRTGNAGAAGRAANRRVEAVAMPPAR